MATPYNPLDKGNLGVSVREALLQQPVRPMADLLAKLKKRYSNKFLGAGIYAIYYTGPFEQYKRVSDQNKNEQFICPIYVGKAVPKGSRKGGIVKDAQNSTALADRLIHHADSIQAATNLDLTDFFCRALVVDDIWIPLGETYMIEKFQPVWNKVVEGFGIKTPGKRRKDQYRSLWDTIHPGRRFVTNLQLPAHPKGVAQILSEIEEYLMMPEEEKAKVPVKDNSEPEDEEE